MGEKEKEVKADLAEAKMDDRPPPYVPTLKRTPSLSHTTFKIWFSF